MWVASSQAAVTSSSTLLCDGRLPHVANDHREQTDQRNKRGVEHDVLELELRRSRIPARTIAPRHPAYSEGDAHPEAG